MALAQDHDASTGPANTDASPVCDWKVWDDIIGTQSAANLSAGRWSGVLCSPGAEAGSCNIGLYDIVDYLQLLYELLHAFDLDSDGCTLSDAGGNSVSRRMHKSWPETGISLVLFVHAFNVHFGTLSSSWDALRTELVCGLGKYWFPTLDTYF